MMIVSEEVVDSRFGVLVSISNYRWRFPINGTYRFFCRLLFGVKIRKDNADYVSDPLSRFRTVRYAFDFCISASNHSAYNYYRLYGRLHALSQAGRHMHCFARIDTLVEIYVHVDSRDITDADSQSHNRERIDLSLSKGEKL